MMIKMKTYITFFRCILAISICFKTTGWSADVDIELWKLATPKGMITWTASKEQLSKLPRWQPGDKIPLTFESCIELLTKQQNIPESAVLVQVTFRRINERAIQSTGLNNVYFYVATYDLNRDTDRFRTFVILPDGSILKDKLSE